MTHSVQLRKATTTTASNTRLIFNVYHIKKPLSNISDNTIIKAMAFKMHMVVDMKGIHARFDDLDNYLKACPSCLPLFCSCFSSKHCITVSLSLAKISDADTVRKLLCMWTHT